MRFNIITTVWFLLLFPFSVIAQNPGCENFEVGSPEWQRCAADVFDSAGKTISRFQLFSGCSPVSIRITELGNYASDISLTEDVVRDLLEARLRSARIYNPVTPLAILEANIKVLKVAYRVKLSYIKYVEDDLSGVMHQAATWVEEIIGQNSKLTSGVILDDLSYLTNEFLADFLQVNDPLCDKYELPDWAKEAAGDVTLR